MARIADAAEMQIESPVHESVEDTHSSYHECMDSILEHIASGKRARVTIASHNATSCQRALECMDRLQIDPKEGSMSRTDSII